MFKPKKIVIVLVLALILASCSGTNNIVKDNALNMSNEDANHLYNIYQNENVLKKKIKVHYNGKNYDYNEFERKISFKKTQKNLILKDSVNMSKYGVDFSKYTALIIVK